MKDQTDRNEIMRLLAGQQRRLYAYVLTLVTDPVAADDILQQTNVVVLQKYDEFDTGTNFNAWVSKIAYFQVLAYLKTKSRERLRFDPELVTRISDAVLQRQPVLDDRLVSLRGCIRKLTEVDRDLIRRRYGQGADIMMIAEAVSRSRKAVKQALYRIRGSLMQCIQRTLSGEH
jgi:RNA polymerase sigma-70 factor, ECF subfamily